MVRRLRRLALAVSRSRIGARLVGAVLRRAPGVVPGVRFTSPVLVVMDHPVPMVPGHRLAVTRGGIPDAARVGEPADAFWNALGDWWDAANDAPPAIGITNLGERQEVRLLHVHLLPDDPSPSRSRADTHRGTSLGGALADLRGTVALDGITASVFLTRSASWWEVWTDGAEHDG